MHKIENKNLKVIIPSKVELLIKMYCSLVSDLEWSGVLFYKLVKNEQLNLEVELLDIQLMDIGTAGHTTYNYDGSMGAKSMKYIFSGQGGLIGHIHSHNNMQVFFSGEDVSELKDNCKEHAFYLSVIVNNAGDVTARGVIKEEVEYTIQKKGNLIYQSKEKMIYDKETKTVTEYRYYEAEIVKQSDDTSFTKAELTEYLDDYKNVYLKKKEKQRSAVPVWVGNTQKAVTKNTKKSVATQRIPNNVIQHSNYLNVLLDLTAVGTRKASSINSNIAVALEEGLSVQVIVTKFKEALREFTNAGVTDSVALHTMSDIVETKLNVYPVIRDAFLRIISDQLDDLIKQENRSVDVVLNDIFSDQNNNSNLFD